MNNLNALLRLTELSQKDERIKKILNTLEECHLETFSHSMQVAFITANYIENNSEDFTEEEAEHLIIASFLHDIGKMDCPRELLDKIAPLTTREYKKIQEHSENGAKALRKMGFPERVWKLVLYHHYREDAKSYPSKLPSSLKQDKSFMKMLEVLSIADIFSAIVQTRSYHSARSCEYAMAELQNEYFSIDTLTKFKKLVDNSGQILVSNYADFTA